MLASLLEFLLIARPWNELGVPVEKLLEQVACDFTLKLPTGGMFCRSRLIRSSSHLSCFLSSYHPPSFEIGS